MYVEENFMKLNAVMRRFSLILKGGKKERWHKKQLKDQLEEETEKT